MREEKHALAFAKAASRVIRNSPDAWRDFIKLLHDRNEIVRNQLVSSAGTDVYVAQGRARELASLLNDLEQSVHIADQAEDKRIGTRS